MILKGSCRTNGTDLATHLMNGYDNERAELSEVRGSIADDLHGAFAEIELIASGTRAQKPLFSLSINPHEALTREQYFVAIDAIESKLGFAGQPRAVVFHEKEGREHCHVVWSRIDAESMKAIPDSFYKARLCDMAVVLAEQFGHELPEGLKRWKEKNRKFDEKLEPTLAETANEKKTGVSAEDRWKDITAAYTQADSAAAFVNALEEKGYVLARGDSRAYVIVDRFGDVHSLSRYLKGVRAKDINARLSALDVNGLPNVEQAKDQARARLAAEEERLRERQDAQHDHHHDTDHDHRRDRDNQADRHEDDDRRKRSIDEKRTAMEKRQLARELELALAEQDLLTRHQHEQLALDAAQKSESAGLFFRVRASVASLIEKTPALRSVLGHITSRTGLIRVSGIFLSSKLLPVGMAASGVLWKVGRMRRPRLLIVRKPVCVAISSARRCSECCAKSGYVLQQNPKVLISAALNSCVPISVCSKRADSSKSSMPPSMMSTIIMMMVTAKIAAAARRGVAGSSVPRKKPRSMVAAKAAATGIVGMIELRP
ncbi:MAG: relaxase/mobilization nuclease domain-containing protein [Paracoccus sp. (in: a-proteobacteria)]